MAQRLYTIRFRWAAVFIPLLTLAFVSCNRDDDTDISPGETVAVAVNFGIEGDVTKSFVNNQSHHVNRILILPFRKTAENLPDVDASFQPAYSLGVQLDVGSFPVNSAAIRLQPGTSYRVLVIGYNTSDYDFKNQSSPANRFSMGAATTPVHFGNFSLIPSTPVVVPEFFTCTAQASLGGVQQGATFKPEQGVTLTGQLKRLVSGFSVTLTDVPTYVKSISLIAGNLVKSSRTLDAAPVTWQVAGDGAIRILAKKTPSAGSVVFDQYLLPTLDAQKTEFYLDVEFGGSVQRYSVLVADGVVSSGNKLIFNPNQAINLTGSYTKVNFGFTLNYGINLDDNQWDGLHND